MDGCVGGSESTSRVSSLFFFLHGLWVADFQACCSSPLEIRNLLDDGPDLTRTPDRAP